MTNPTIAILTIGYRKYAMDLASAAKVVALLDDATSVDDAYDTVKTRGPTFYYHHAETPHTVSMTLTRETIEPARRPEPPKEEDAGQ